jgi:hypothetical protein
MPPINTDEQRGFCGVTMQWPFKDRATSTARYNAKNGLSRKGVPSRTHRESGRCRYPKRHSARPIRPSLRNRHMWLPPSGGRNLRSSWQCTVG